MTNEEKAREVVGGNWVVFNKEYSAALQIAEWKDCQFKEYLENKVKAYKCRGEAFFDREITAIEKIINELFKKD